MEQNQQALVDLKPQKEFFIGIDSDGCVFDTMEIKQKECFCPNFIKHFNLQPIQKYARETWEFVNLYSSNRGCNRFLALVYAFDLLAARKEIKERNFVLSDIEPLWEWVKNETKLCNQVLEDYAAKVKNPLIDAVLNWSKDVNKAIKEMGCSLPPFMFVKEVLIKMAEKADLMVVSQTPYEALSREWKDNEMDNYVRMIAGQELGTKAEHIKYAASEKYPNAKILMIGDAFGDLKAATSNNVLFYPVNPGNEEESWKKLNYEALQRFFEGTYEGEYESTLIGEFKKCLPEKPGWI